MTKRHGGRENLTPEEQLEAIKDSNDERMAALPSPVRMQLAGAFEGMRIKTYLVHILMDLGILERAELELETLKSEQLDKAAEMVSKAEAEALIHGLPRGPGEPPLFGGRIIKP